MYEPKYAKDIRCPLEYGLKVFGGKWKSRIICVLAEKKKLRYSALRRDMATCKSSKDHSKPRNEVDTSLKSPV